jgi:hypothetical protein
LHIHSIAISLPGFLFRDRRSFQKEIYEKTGSSVEIL